MAFALLANTAKQFDTGTTGNSTAIDTTGATLILAIVVDWMSVNATFSDNQSNTWVADVTKNHDASSARVRLMRCFNPTTSATHTFIATGAGTAFPAIAIAAFSGGVNTAGPDQTNSNSTGGATTLTTGSVTPSENNELIFSGLSDAWATTVSIDSGQTILNQLGLVGGTSFAVASAYEIQSGLTTRNPQWTMPASARAEAVIATYRALAGGARTQIVMVT